MSATWPRRAAVLLALLLAAAPLAASAQDQVAASRLQVALAPDAANPASPRMGDRLRFHAAIRNPVDGGLAEGIVAWLTILRVDAGREQAIDLEDWSADKAVTLRRLPPGATARSDWSLRLIAPGSYRVLVSAASRDAPVPAVAASAIFHVAPKPVVDSARVLPVALGVPALLGLLLAARLRRGRALQA